MAIRKITLSNFKSFKELNIDIDNFNLLIGANASGKTNFIRVFEFLRDISDYGMEDAISMQGGVRYLRNLDIGPSKNLSVELISDNVYGAPYRYKKGFHVGIKTKEINYKFEIKFNKKGSGFKIGEDRLILKISLVKLTSSQRKYQEAELIGGGEISVSNNKGKIKYITNADDSIKPILDKSMPKLRTTERIRKDSLLIEFPLFGLPFDYFELTNLYRCSIYDFDPKLPKKATPITGRAFFEEDGSNLAIVIKNIIEQKDSRRMFFNLIKDLLPFVSELGVDKFADKSVLIKLREKYSEKYLPACFISDGTLNIVALIIALYFDRKRLSIIEEPERNIHPYLISKVMAMMKDAATKKQLIVTTHNPEMVRYADLKNILFASRDKDGFTLITRPGDKESVKQFLQNEIGVAEMFTKNLFEG